MPKPQLSCIGEVLQLDVSPGVQFRSIPPFASYAVGDDGSFWTRKTRGPQVNFGPWKRMELWEDYCKHKPGNLPYLRVCLSNIKSHWYRCHLVVLTCFRGPRPDGMQGRHLNGNCQDNRLDNLVWGTPVENMADKLAHGRSPRGNGTNKAKLTEDQVREIRALQGIEIARIVAARYGVSLVCIYNIWNRKRWWYVA